MTSIMQSQVFFFISSIGFVVLGIFVGVLLFYLIRISSTFSRIIDKAEQDINNIGDATREVLAEIRESTLFHILSKLFKKKRKHRKDEK